MSDKNIFSVRLSPERAAKLDYLSQLFNFSKNEYIGLLIDAKYDQLKGNPQIEEMMKKIQEFNVWLKDVK